MISCLSSEMRGDDEMRSLEMLDTTATISYVTCDTGLLLRALQDQTNKALKNIQHTNNNYIQHVRYIQPSNFNAKYFLNSKKIL